MPKLERTLTTWQITIFGVGLVLGAGIYSIVGAAAGRAGESLWLSFLIAGMVAALTALSYAELATMYPQAGAEYVYLANAAPKLGWARRMLGSLLVFTSIAMSATVAIAFAGYFRAFVDLPAPLIAGALLIVTAGINVIGMRESSWLNAVMTLIEASGLILVIAAGFSAPDFGKALLVQPDLGVLAGAGLVFFAFLGFEDIANVAEEARDPGRSIPRAILWCITVSTVLYVLIGLSATALLPSESLASSDRPLAEAIGAAWPHVSSALGGIALFATANTALVALIVASRMAFGMARDGDLPAWLASVMPKRHSPWAAIVTVVVVALALLPFGSLAVLGGVASFGALLAFASVNVSLVVLRKTRPSDKRPFRVPLSVKGIPVLPILGTVGALGLAFTLPLASYLAGLGAVGLLGVVELVRARRSSA